MPLTFILTLFGCRHREQTGHPLQALTTDTFLSKWLVTFHGLSTSTFRKEQIVPFEKLLYRSPFGLDEFLSIYKPALTYSRDSSMFIDIYSYELGLYREGDSIIYNGSEAEQAITLFGKNGDGKRILFLGYSMRIDEVSWTSDSSFILVGVDMSSNDSLEPIIYLGDIPRQQFQTFRSEVSYPRNKNGYESPKLGRLNIVIK